MKWLVKGADRALSETAAVCSLSVRVHVSSSMPRHVTRMEKCQKKNMLSRFLPSTSLHVDLKVQIASL